MNYTNKGHIRNCDDAKLASMLTDCVRLSDSLMAGRIRHEMASRVPTVQPTTPKDNPMYTKATDFYEEFDGKFSAQFTASATWEEYCTAIGGTRGESLLKYSWAPAVFATAKAGHRTMRSLALPTAVTFSDLFSAATLCASAYIKDRGTYPVGVPQGMVYVGGSSTTPHGHYGGKREWSKNNIGTRSHYGATWYGCYALPVETLYTGYDSFEIVKRSDGFLVIGKDSTYIGGDWLALLPLTANFEDILSEKDREFLASERAADVAAWSAGDPRSEKGE